MKALWRVVVVLMVLVAVACLTFYFQPLWMHDQLTRVHLWRDGVRSEFVEAGGYRIHYFEAPAAAGTVDVPLVLVHGLGARAMDWAAMIPALARDGFHVYALDLPGYGRSSKPRDASYSISMEEAAVVSFMQAVHVPRANVGGWSMGGWVALKLTYDHPEMVHRLILYDSAGVYFPADFGPELFSPDDIAGVHKLLAALSPHPIDVPDFAARAMVRKLQGNKWVIQRSLAAMIDGRDLMDFRLHEIAAPTLIVWGSHDDLIPLSVGEAMHRGIPNSVLDVIRGCGHLAPAECSRPVIEGTVQFLRAEPPMQGGERTFAGMAAN